MQQSNFDNKLKQKLLDLNKVRNSFAHSWITAEIEYNGKSIDTCFDKFKDNLLETWNLLKGVYSIEQDKIKLDEIFTLKL